MSNTQDFSLKKEEIVIPEFNPVGTHVTIQVKKVASKTEGGIFLPDADDFAEKEQMKVNEGKIVKLGQLAYTELRNADLDYPDVYDWACVKTHSGILRYEGECVYRTVQDTDIYIHKKDNKNNEVKENA